MTAAELMAGGLVVVGVSAVSAAQHAYNMKEYEKTKKARRLWLDKLDKNPAATAWAVPHMSGEYRGTSSESESANQALSTTLTFNEDGTISGRGFDSDDGWYEVVDGRWIPSKDDSMATVFWTENYGSRGGFEVLVEGTANLRPMQQGRSSVTRIKARFISSKGVTGKFGLKHVTGEPVEHARWDKRFWPLQEGPLSPNAQRHLRRMEAQAAEKAARQQNRVRAIKRAKAWKVDNDDLARELERDLRQDHVDMQRAVRERLAREKLERDLAAVDGEYPWDYLWRSRET